MRNSTARAFVTVLALTGFLSALTLSVSPQLHERVHPDANRSGHACAVTLVASGNVDHSPATVLVSSPAPIAELTGSELNSQWVEPLFLLAAVLEHAPPVSI